MVGDHTGLGRAELVPADSPVLMYDEVDSGFEVVRRGYDQRQVDAHLGRLDAEIRILIADRNAAVEQAAQLGRELDDCRTRAERLRAQVRTLVNAPTSVPGMSDRMRSMLRLAEDEVHDMLAQAESDATRRSHEAEQEATEIRTAALADAERAAAEDARRRAECKAECSATIEATEEERRGILAELTATKAASLTRMAQSEQDARLRLAEERAAWEVQQAIVEEDFALAMDKRRAAAIAELEADRTETYRRNADMIANAQEQSKRTVTVADEYARRTLLEAERRVADLGAARERVAAQLAQARTILQEALGTLSATPERPAIHLDAAGQPADPDVAGADGTATATGGDVQPPGDADPTDGVAAPSVTAPAVTAPAVTAPAVTDLQGGAAPNGARTPDGVSGSTADVDIDGNLEPASGPPATNGRTRARWRRPSPAPR